MFLRVFMFSILTLDGLVLGFVAWLVGLRGRDDSGADILLRSRLSVKLAQLVRVELGALDDLALANIAVLQRVDALRLLLDLLANALSDELLEHLAQVARSDLAVHNLGHFLTDELHLRGECVAREAALILVLLGEANGEHTNSVAISRPHIDDGLNESLPLAHKGLEEVRRERHASEIR